MLYLRVYINPVPGIGCLVCLIYLARISQCSELISHNSRELRYWENTTTELPMFPTLESTLQFLQQPQYARLQPTNKILYAFDSICMSGNNFYPSSRRRAFIALEGNHRTTLDILSKRLAKRIGASYVKNPPNCLAPYRQLLRNGTPLCKAYFNLGLYALAQRARMLWNQWHVVAKGFWIDQLMYSVSRQNEFPPEGSLEYNWPVDLLVPDLILFVNVPQNVVFGNMSTRSPDSWKNRCQLIPDRIKFVKIHHVTTANGMDQALVDIEAIIVKELSPNFHIQFNEDGLKLKKEPLPR